MQFTLDYLQGIERTLSILEQMAGVKAIHPEDPILPQVDIELDKLKQRTGERFTRRLDELRQRHNGFRQYIWRSADDGKVRAAHAANDDKLFNWDNPPPTGHPGEDYNCRCYAEPVKEGRAEGFFLQEQEYQEAMLGPMIRLAVQQIVRNASAVRAAMQRGVRAFERTRKIPSRRIFRRPKGLPEDWIRRVSHKGVGVKYSKPGDSGTYVRIQKGDPRAHWQSQRKNYVRWQKNGRSLDKYGNIVDKEAPEAHIPLEDFRFIEDLFR